MDAWQLDTWEAYRDVVRLGRKTRLPEPQRAILWSIFERVRAGLVSRKMITRSGMFTKLAAAITASRNPPFDLVVVDEAQDIGVAHLRFFASLGPASPRRPLLRWRPRPAHLSAAVLVAGPGRRHSRTLEDAEGQLPHVAPDPDAGRPVAGARSVRCRWQQGGSKPHGFGLQRAAAGHPRFETAGTKKSRSVGQWVSERAKEGVAPHEFGVFVRSAAELDRARSAVQQSGIPFKILDENVETTSGHVSISTMHLAKGLEFRAVVVMACDDEVIPSQERIETVADEADLEDVYNTERHLLYVACTRARDHLLVTSVAPASEFLDDLRGVGGA